MKNVKNRIRKTFNSKIKSFVKNKYSFFDNASHFNSKCLKNQQACATALKSLDTTFQLENNIIDIEKATMDCKVILSIPKEEFFLDHMNQEACEMHVITNIQNTNVKETTPTTGLILEVSVAIKLSSDDNDQPIILKNVLIDTGCTKTIIKRKILPDQFFNHGNSPMKSLGQPTLENS